MILWKRWLRDRLENQARQLTRQVESLTAQIEKLTPRNSSLPPSAEHPPWQAKAEASIGEEAEAERAEWTQTSLARTDFQ